MSSNEISHHFIWRDCLTTDIDQTIEFFKQIAQWKLLEQVSPTVGRYPIVKNQDRAIAGILKMPSFLQASGVPPYWTGYVNSNVETVAALVPTLGGQIFTPPSPSPMGTSFVFTDSGGAVLSAFQPADAFIIPSAVGTGDFVWQRLYAADAEKSELFYRELFNWNSSRKEPILRTESGEAVGDIGGKPSWIQVDTWVYFLRVKDLAHTISLLEKHPGEIIETTEIQGQPAVVVKDSQGAVVGFTEFSEQTSN